MIPSPERSQVVIEALRSEDPVLRRRLGYGAFVGSRFRYLYLEAPKAACTTTKVHLWHLEQLGPLPYPNYVHMRPPEDQRQSLLTIGEDAAIEALCGPSVFRFCVWRDPVRRLASVFSAKIQLARDPGIEWIQRRKRIVSLFGLDSEKQITFDHFAQFVCARPDERRDPHFMSQWRLTMSELVRYHRIVRVERYADDMADVYRGIGVPSSEWPDFGGLRENFTGSEAVDVAEATASMIRNAYRLDYEMLDAGSPARHAAISF